MLLQIKKSYSLSFSTTYIMELWVLHAMWHLIPCSTTVGLICWSLWLALKSLWGFQLYCSLSECVWRAGVKRFLINFIWKQNKGMLKKLKERLYLIFSSNLVGAPTALYLEVLAPEASTRDRHLAWSPATGDRLRCFLTWKLPHVFNRLQLSFSSMDISVSFVNLCEGYCPQCSVAWGNSPWSSTLVILFDALQFSHRNSD